MVRVRVDRFGDLRLFSLCKELERRKLISSSYPQALLDTGRESAEVTVVFSVQASSTSSRRCPRSYMPASIPPPTRCTWATC